MATRKVDFVVAGAVSILFAQIGVNKMLQRSRGARPVLAPSAPPRWAAAQRKDAERVRVGWRGVERARSESQPAATATWRGTGRRRVGGRAKISGCGAWPVGRVTPAGISGLVVVLDHQSR